MNRRTFLCGLTLGTISAPLAAEPQQAGRVYRVGILFQVAGRPIYLQVVLQALRELRYVEGQNLAIEFRSAEGRVERLPDLAAELVGLRVDVIIAAGTAGTRAAKSATATIPIVMAAAGDPVLAGFVQSMARPGGNITGLTSDVTPETWSKRLQLLTEVAPRASRVALLWNRRALKGADFVLEQLNGAASKLKVTVRSIEVRGPDDLAAMFASMTHERIDGMVFVASADLFSHLRQIAELAVERRIPMISIYRDVAVAGGLISYGPDLRDIFRRTATYVDKILKGAKPADLPVEQPTKFELVINLKTAKALGLTIPQTLLLRADQVIQ